MMSGRRLRLAAIALAVVLAAAGGAFALYAHFRPYLHGTNCEARGTSGVVPLDLEQASNAATIAAVGIRKKLPEQATVIAYATALQESHLRNLSSGDRDSVGLFQQRPSQGWGTVDQLTDPVYATSKFFGALVKVKDFGDLPVHVAAQRVQRSADGTAYARHEGDAKILAVAYTGRLPGAVRCWYPPNKRKKTSEAKRAVGKLRATLNHHDTGDDPAVPNARTGWAMAGWLVAHAQSYGIRDVGYAGKHWRATEGHAGWTNDKKAPTDRITVR